jgi:hypothetical protein
MDWPVAITVIGGLFALAFAIVKMFQESRTNEDWKRADMELEKRISRMEHVQKNVVKAYDDLKEECDMSGIEQRIATIEANHKNLAARADELRYGQEKLDVKLDRLTDLMIRYLSDN